MDGVHRLKVRSFMLIHKRVLANERSARRAGPAAKLVGASRLERRCVTVPAYCLAWLASTALLPFLLAFAVVIGVVRRRSFVVLRLVLYQWLYLSFALAALVALFANSLRPRRRRDAGISRISTWYGSSLFSWCVRLLSLSVVVEGDEVPETGPLLVLVRHASIVDAALPAALVGTRGLVLRYVLRKELMLEPVIDIVGHWRSHCFVDRDGPARQELARISNAGADLDTQAIVVYPEGTRFSEAKRIEAIRSLRRTRPRLADNAATMTHVLPPKLAGLRQLLKVVPEADCLVIAHRGLEGFASLRDFLDGSIVGREIHVRAWRIGNGQIPPPDQQSEWLFEVWREVDDFAAGRHTGDA